jgi:predicted small metal-binding protein
MAKVINCECGIVIRGETDDELVTNAQVHARDEHKYEITRKQALAVAETVES